MLVAAARQGNAHAGATAAASRTGVTMPSKILVVDDDPAICNLVAEYLRDHDFGVDLAADGRAMGDILAGGAVDLVVLDLKLRDEDGLKLVRDLRTASPVPIIVLTGARRDEVDRIVGLELGADDYLLKPFSPRELLARIRAVLRRAELGRRPAGADDKRARYRFAGWELHARTRRLTSPSGSLVPLTNGEFGLLTALLRSPQRVLSREHLLAASRLHGDDVFDRSVDAQILRLRRKLEANPSAPLLIRTERGAGYVFAAPVEIV
jgi:DNA-binding response OmpR family regulator